MGPRELGYPWRVTLPCILASGHGSGDFNPRICLNCDRVGGFALRAFAAILAGVFFAACGHQAGRATPPPRSPGRHSINYLIIQGYIVSQQDRAFMTTFIGILAVLVVIAFVFYFIARLATSGGEASGPDPRMEARILQNIAPVENVRLGAAAAQDAAPAPAAAPAAASGKGQEIYQASCFACHGTGAAGAPVLGDQATWAPRIAQGMDTLMSHTINGFNAMPAKGLCFTCSDDDLKATVEYMIAESQ